MAGSQPSKQFVVITSIFKPSEAVKKLSNLLPDQLVIVGDRKTPADWSQPGAIYVSVSDQETMSSRLGQILPWNHYCRKMLGYLVAVERGAEIIVDTDDDNIPLDDWEFPSFRGSYDVLSVAHSWFNIYRLFSDKPFLWPRGFPLELLEQDRNRRPELMPQNCNVGIWQGLADGNPDVDAIYRLVINEPVQFLKRPPVVFKEGVYCPFNSQNTAFRREFFPLLYLPATVTFRFTDILRGLVAQPILWAAKSRLGFLHATVFQERNEHNFLKDFEQEIPCYLHADQVVKIVEKAVEPSESCENNLKNAYLALAASKIVKQEELQMLDAWLSDLKERRLT